MKGIVIKNATKRDPRRADDTTIGIGFMNSPIIPVPNIRGTNAHTVVMVVVRIATLKSLKTKSAVSYGVNFLVLK